MTSVTVDNQVVSIQLNNGESTTVPSGEKWEVTITVAIRDGSSNARVYSWCEINGTRVLSVELNTNDGEYAGVSSCVAETTLVGGDTISASGDSSNGGVSIGGYEVS